MVKIGDYELHIGRKRDPQGYYVAVLNVRTYELLREAIEKLNIQIERAGDIVFLKSRSWTSMNKLTNICETRGIKVLYRR